MLLVIYYICKCVISECGLFCKWRRKAFLQQRQLVSFYLINLFMKSYFYVKNIIVEMIFLIVIVVLLSAYFVGRLEFESVCVSGNTSIFVLKRVKFFKIKFQICYCFNKTKSIVYNYAFRRNNYIKYRYILF